MENGKLIPGFIGDLKRRNTPEYQRKRIAVRYSLIFIISVVAGLLFCKGLTDMMPQDNPFYTLIRSGFGNILKDSSGFRDGFSRIIKASIRDIRDILILFLTGFTYFCGIASSAVIIVRGFASGFSVFLLWYSVSKGALLLPHPVLSIALYCLSTLITVALLVFSATVSLVFEYEFKNLNNRKRLIVCSPLLYKYMLYYLTAFGAVILINTVNSLLSVPVYG